MKVKNIKIMALMACFMVCLVFAGCAKVTYALVKPDSNTIIQQLKVELDIEDIQAHNADVSEVKTSVEDYVLTYKSNVSGAFQNNLMILRSGTQADRWLADALEGAVTIVNGWEGNTYYFQLQFVAIIEDGVLCLPVENVYYYFFTGELEISSDEEDEDSVQAVLDDKLFMQVYKETYTTSFDSELCTNVENAFMEKYGTYGFTLDDVAYVYKYGQQYRRVHSDADSIEKQDGIYIHTWNLADKTQPITLYRNYAKPVAWYVVAIVAGVVSVGVVLVVGVVQRAKRKSNQLPPNQSV